MRVEVSKTTLKAADLAKNDKFDLAKALIKKKISLLKSYKIKDKFIDNLLSELNVILEKL